MFKDRDIICFLGDSITASGLWVAEVYQHLRKNYKIKCYNCGVSGSIAERALGYMYEECLIYNPDYVVLMLGMNDMAINGYSRDDELTDEIIAYRKKWFDKHKENYENIIKNCISSGAEVIICLPTPYDEVSEVETKAFAYQQALETAAAFQLEMADKYGCKVVNFKDNMLPMLGKEPIINDDRVHPSEYGQHVMAQIFLKEIGQVDECDFKTPFEFEEWNKLRFEAESKNRRLNYVELCDTYYDGYALNKSVDEIKEIVKERLENYKGDSVYIAGAYAEYIELGHLRVKNKGEIVKLTKF